MAGGGAFFEAFRRFGADVGNPVVAALAGWIVADFLLDRLLPKD